MNQDLRRMAEEVLSDEQIMQFADETHLVSDCSFEDYKPYLKAFAAKAIAPYAARLKQAEDVLRMAKKAMESSTDQTIETEQFFEMVGRAIAAINQQLGEK